MVSFYSPYFFQTKTGGNGDITITMDNLDAIHTLFRGTIGSSGADFTSFPAGAIGDSVQALSAETIDGVALQAGYRYIRVDGTAAGTNSTWKEHTTLGTVPAGIDVVQNSTSIISNASEIKIQLSSLVSFITFEDLNSNGGRVDFALGDVDNPLQSGYSNRRTSKSAGDAAVVTSATNNLLTIIPNTGAPSLTYNGWVQVLGARSTARKTITSYANYALSGLKNVDTECSNLTSDDMTVAYILPATPNLLTGKLSILCPTL